MSDDYQDACRHAADAQGITDIAEALKTLGVDCEVHQSGGFVMLVWVNCPSGGFYYVDTETCGHYKDLEDEGRTMLEFHENHTASDIASDVAKLIFTHNNNKNQP